MATVDRGEPATFVDVLKRVLVGRSMPTHRLEHTLLPKILALPVFSSDPLSSVAYATEESLRVLLAASAAAFTLVMPISITIAALLVIVVISYRQTVRAYPNGGGAYIVSKENLGVFPGLLAAAALLTDYVLTVSVSVVAGVFAITSAVPSLNEHKVALSIGFILLITLANLRGVRESGTLFAIPTYGFVASIYVLLAVGLSRCLLSGCPHAVVPHDVIALGPAGAGVSLFIILHAFSSGSTALTGVEAISNGVPAFRRPQSRNAAATLGIMGVISITMFLGISFLAQNGRAIPSETKSVVAQIPDGVFHGGMVRHWLKVRRVGDPDASRGWKRSIVINGVGAVATGVVLVIVVETKFMHGAWIVIAAMPLIIAGFYGIHRHYEGIFRQLHRGGPALAESPRSIVILYVVFQDTATTEAVGYVRSFTGGDFRAIHLQTAQSPPDLVQRWKAFCRTTVELEVLPAGRHPTTTVREYIRSIPREEGDFVTVVIPELLAKRSLLSAVRRGTSFLLKVRLLSEPQVVITDVPVMKEQGGPPAPLIPEWTVALVFVSAAHDPAVRAVNYARSLRANEVRAVFFALDPSEVEEIQRQWEERRMPIAPELVVKKWWHNFLHNQRALFIKRLLLFEPRVILSSVPYKLK